MEIAKKVCVFYINAFFWEVPILYESMYTNLSRAAQDQPSVFWRLTISLNQYLSFGSVS